ncbi:ena/VASP-like protein [Portunus trituberculatus]|uniref:ena/VASP-like protein n=1 Tax=Portunus trituberculatus TaxID=210409 RepID=UPI001E1D1D78|nr:ena/VASP-like protein [Portunus trituberculatus]
MQPPNQQPASQQEQSHMQLERSSREVTAPPPIRPPAGRPVTQSHMESASTFSTSPPPPPPPPPPPRLLRPLQLPGPPPHPGMVKKLPQRGGDAGDTARRAKQMGIARGDSCDSLAAEHKSYLCGREKHTDKNLASGVQRGGGGGGQGPRRLHADQQIPAHKTASLEESHEPQQDRRDRRRSRPPSATPSLPQSVDGAKVTSRQRPRGFQRLASHRPLATPFTTAPPCTSCPHQHPYSYISPLTSAQPPTSAFHA